MAGIKSLNPSLTSVWRALHCRVRKSHR